MAEVFLTAAVRQNLLSLQATSALAAVTQGRLATGLKVASAIDDAVAYFTSKGLADRAADINLRKSEIDQAISAVKAAVTATESVDSIVKQMKGLAIAAKTATDAEQLSLKNQFTELAKQLNLVLGDATYNGTNLVQATTAKLTVQFSDNTSSKLDISGQNIKASVVWKGTLANSVAKVTLLATRIAGALWSNAATSQFDRVISYADTAISKVRAAAKSLGSNVSFLQSRLDFSKGYANTLVEGADKLRLADLNEEGANLVALQTRQQLALQALAFAGQTEQAVLTLFR
jgi:flagellin-like hook-associated protein FlgL